MDRRTFVALAGAAAIAGELPSLARAQAGVATEAIMAAPEIKSYAMMLTYSDHKVMPFSSVDALVIHPRGKVDVADGWTIERAMTEIWPGPGKWWSGDNLNAFFELSYKDNGFAPVPKVAVEQNAPGPAVLDGETVGIISQDGTVEFGPQFDGDESDRAAWREMGRMFVTLAAQ